MSVIVIGGGWAGLAAACTLVSHGIPAQLLESAPQLGGRARSFSWQDARIDNGSHLLIGAYRETLHLLRQIGVDEQRVLHRDRLSLEVMRAPSPLHIRAPNLPAPLHLLAALWRGLRGEERRTALRFCFRAWRNGFHQHPDISVAELLHDQPSSLTDALWRPLCLATLNTPIERASAQVFLRVLRDAFSRRQQDSNLLHPRAPLGELLAAPAHVYIEGHGGRVRLRCRAQHLDFSAENPAVITAQGRLDADHLILASAPWQAARLLDEHAPLRAQAEQLRALGDAPITTVYLAYPECITLGRSMLGFDRGTLQWLIDHGITRGQAGLMAAVISGAASDQPPAALQAQVLAELAQHFPHWPPPLGLRTVRERRATFLSTVGCNADRPDNATAEPRLYLAGDYTNTGYPATLEGAVRSGVHSAHLLIQHIKHKRPRHA